MKYGIREICEVVLKAKSTMQVGNKIFYKHEPVIYFDTLKTSTLEGAATTVYAQGGRGNSRLVAWEGERTLTFTMEDALISTAGLMILTGAGLIDGKDTELRVHTTETTDEVIVNGNTVTITLNEVPYTAEDGDYIYVMALKDGEVISEPYIPTVVMEEKTEDGNTIQVPTNKVTITLGAAGAGDDAQVDGKDAFVTGGAVLVDYYVTRTTGAQQIEITPDKFGGNYYLEASTLFRDTNGVDLPAEFIIPNCKIQSNFTFTMASSGDPSTFTFTMDAFPDYTRFNQTKKVLCAIQVIDTSAQGEATRDRTASAKMLNELGEVVDKQ